MTYRCRWRPCARSRGLPPPAGTIQSESSQPYGSPASSMPAKATCAPSGDHDTNLHEPGNRASSSGSPPRARTTCTDCAALEIGALAAICAERDAFAVGRPGEALDRPVAARQAARASTRPRLLDEQVRVPVDVAVSVVSPVGAGDHARQRLGCPPPAGRRRSAPPGSATASASRPPRGACAKALTPCGSAVSCSASPPSSGTAQTCSSRRKSTRSPCGVDLRRGVAHVA